MFNYQNLEPGQFERLCRDIMQIKTGTELHVFARGRDGGVDLTDDSDKHNIVVQVKHYEKSGFTALRNNLEKEVEKVKKLNPKQYYICVSQSLTDANVNTIYQMFSDYMESTNNILTLDDIDNFLHDPENIQITRNHTNLWLESGTTLQLLLECFPNMQEYLGDANGMTAPQTVYPKCLTPYIPLGPEVGLIGRNDIVDRVRAIIDQIIQLADSNLVKKIEPASAKPDYASTRQEFENYQVRAQEGDANAQYKLGSIYSTGQNVIVKDDEKALFWYSKAADVSVG